MIRRGTKAPRLPRDVKKSRKSAALIIAEENIKELKDDVKALWKLAWVSLGFIITTLITLVGFFAAPFFHR